MTTLPDGLRQQFEALEARLWRTDTAIAVCGSAVALLSAFGLQFLSDRLWDTPGWFRALLIGTALAVVIACLFYYGRRWIWGHRTIESLAAIVQKRYRRLGDRLLGIVELADVARRPQNVSPALCEAAIRQVAGEAATINFTDAVETRKSNRLKTALILMAIVIATPWLLAPQACWNALSRLLQPANPVHRYTFVGLNELPDSLYVPHGEPFVIEVGIARQDFLNPTDASARFEKQPIIHVPVESGMARFQIPGQTNEGKLRIRLGDASRDITVVPLYRPELRALEARIEYPSYLKYPPAAVPVKSATLSLVDGSRAVLSGRASRNLKLAEAQLVETGAHEPLTASVSGANFETESIEFSQGKSRAAELRWTDEHGLTPSIPWTLKLEGRQDEPPSVTVSGLAAAVAILETESLKVGSESNDDFGVRDLGMTWEIEKAPATSTEALATSGDQRVARGEPQLRSLDAEWEFSPSKLGIRGDSIVLLRASARDYLPTRAPALSGAYRVYVLGPESHAKLIHNEFDKILAKLDDIARAQEELIELGKQLQSLSPEELKKPENAAKLKEQAEAQERLEKQLKELSEKAAETLKEAMRNQSMDPQTLNAWAEHTQAMQAIASSMMKQASQQLSNAGKSAEQREKELKEALANEQKALEQLRDIQKKASETQDQMTQQNIAMRLRKLGDAHGEAGKVLTKLLPEIAGLATPDLPEPLRKTLENMTGEQEQRRTAATDLHGEIERFFNRTKLEKYGTVSKSMNEIAMDAKLAALVRLIADNASVTVIEQGEVWKNQFHEWANLIDAKNDSKSQGEGQPGQPSPEQIKVMMELMRIRQQELALRSRTVSLEKGRERNENYAQEAKAAAEEQRGLMEAAKAVGENPAFCPGPKAMEPVTAAMGDAAKELDIPKTDKPAVDAETDAINLLDHLMQSQCKGSGMKAMAGMMAGMGQGASPGGSMAGGDTSKENDPITGKVTGDKGEDRTTERVAGVDPNLTPAEFRDALQGYYQSVEKEAP